MTTPNPEKLKVQQIHLRQAISGEFSLDPGTDILRMHATPDQLQAQEIGPTAGQDLAQWAEHINETLRKIAVQDDQDTHFPAFVQETPQGQDSHITISIVLEGARLTAQEDGVRTETWISRVLRRALTL